MIERKAAKEIMQALRHRVFAFRHFP